MKIGKLLLMLLFALTLGVKGFSQPIDNVKVGTPGNGVNDDYKHQFSKRKTYNKSSFKSDSTISVRDNYKHQASATKKKKKALVVKVGGGTGVPSDYKHSQMPMKRH